jgi:hypothetical protein
MAFREGLGCLARLAGWFVGNLPLNTLRMTGERPGRKVLKRRRWYAAPVAVAGNVYSAMLGLNIRVLHNRAWLRREVTLYRRLYGERVVWKAGGWLEVPCLGDALSVFLGSPHQTGAAKLRALATATRDLERLHGIRVEENGTFRRFSHGDACVCNVTYCPELDRAHWFDFENVHTGKGGDEWRHADDFRALLFTAAGCLPESLVGQAFDAMLEAYADRAVLQALV